MRANKAKFSHRVYSIKTRIKTNFASYVYISVHLIEYIPLKQGLRLQHSVVLPLKTSSSHRVYSIKTRIKTTGDSIDTLSYSGS